MWIVADPNGINRLHGDDGCVLTSKARAREIAEQWNSLADG